MLVLKMEGLCKFMMIVWLATIVKAVNFPTGPHSSFKGMFNFKNLMQKANLMDRFKGTGIRGQRLGNKNSNTIDFPANSNGFMDNDHGKGFPVPPLKASKLVLLMNSRGLIAEACRASSYNHTIQSRGCIPKTIQLKHCSGRCNSFYVPTERGEFRFCSHCLPKKSKFAAVILSCPGRATGFKVKPVRMIESCACQSVKSCSNWSCLEDSFHGCLDYCDYYDYYYYYTHSY